MSVRLEPKLPYDLFNLMNGEHLDEHLNKVVLLITVDEGGWPYARSEEHTLNSSHIQKSRMPSSA